MAGSGWRQRMTAPVYFGLAVVALANGGCLVAAVGAAGAGAGVAGYAYHKGKVYQEYNANFEDTLAAAHTALQELGLPVLSEERTGGSVLIEGRTGTGERLRLYLDTVVSPIPIEGPLTRVGVRVATFGDQILSERILGQIGAHLVSGSRARPQPAAPTLGPIQPSWNSAPGARVVPIPAPTVTPASHAPQSPEPPLLDLMPRGN